MGRPQLTVLLSLLLLALTSLLNAAGDAMLLKEAITAGDVTARIRGTGQSSGDSILLTLARGASSGSGELVLTIPAGTLLHSSDGKYQDMVFAGVRGLQSANAMLSPAAEMRLPASDAVTYVIEAYCANFNKLNPSEQTTFTIGEGRPILACIARKNPSMSVTARQAAIWMQTDAMTFSRINLKLRVSPAEWQAAQAAFVECGGSSRLGLDERMPQAGETYIQVLAVRRANAELVRRRLLEKGYRSIVLMPVEQTPQMYRVLVGPLMEDAVDVTKASLESDGFKPFLKRF